MVASNGLFFFRAESSGEGLEPWRSDGTAEGTFPLADIAPGQDDSFPWNFVATDNGACFTATSEEGPPAIRHLWCSDGTVGGTHQGIQVGDGYIPGPAFQGHVLFRSTIDGDASTRSIRMPRPWWKSPRR